MSSLGSESLETIAEITDGKAWYQLYVPSDTTVLEDILCRLETSGYKNLMVTVDMPTFAFRPNDIKNCVTMPPKKTLNNIYHAALKPKWSAKTISKGIPTYKNLDRYIDSRTNNNRIDNFINTMCMGSTDYSALQKLRDRWKGNLIIKGVLSEEDIRQSVSLGIDGIVVSNHGGRQCDRSLSTANVMQSSFIDEYRKSKSIMCDSGLQDGQDVASALSLGAEFTFLGRYFTYAVCALGEQGADHAVDVLEMQLSQVMEQLFCGSVDDLRGLICSNKQML